MQCMALSQIAAGSCCQLTFRKNENGMLGACAVQSSQPKPFWVVHLQSSCVPAALKLIANACRAFNLSPSGWCGPSSRRLGSLWTWSGSGAGCLMWALPSCSRRWCWMDGKPG